MSLSASLFVALGTTYCFIPPFCLYSFVFFFPLIASLLFSLSLASPENGVISWAEAILAANCPCNRKEPVGRSKSEEARCCLKPVTWANTHWLRAWAVHVSCLQHQAEASVVFHPLGHACHGCHKSSTDLNTYHSKASVPDQTASSVAPSGAILGVDPQLHSTPAVVLSLKGSYQ